MLVAAVIAEYNPLHNGHAYHLAETRRRGATHIAVVMGGNFTQRGEPALLGKRARARAALLCGADLVVELPLPYAAAGAQRFARGAVALADALCAVKYLSFGCECGTEGHLVEAADALEDPAVWEGTRRRLAAGETFARARGAAVAGVYGEEMARRIAMPNNILALEYMAALRDLNSRMRPMAIARRGAGHDALNAAGGLMSASALRRAILSGEPEAAWAYMPAASAEALTAGVCRPEAMELPLLSRLREMGPEDFKELPELSEGLENRLYRASRQALTLDELYRLTKSRRYSHARVRRLAIAAFLGLREELSAGPPPYLRVLGMNARGAEILSAGTRISAGTSLKRLASLDARARRFAEREARAGDQYALLCVPRGACGADYRDPLIKL